MASSKSAMTENPDDPMLPPAEPAPPEDGWRSRLRSWRSRLPPMPPRRTIFRIISWTVGVFFVLFLVLGIYVYRTSVGRFQIRKLRLPTRIYADITPLRTGGAFQTDDLLEKLDRLGYRDVERLTQPGEFTRGDGGIDIYTRAFTHPTGEYPAEQIRVVLDRSAIESVVSLREA